MGFGTVWYKLTAFTLAGTLAGVAGYLWAAQTGFVNPELMGFHLSAHAIMMVILGGMGNFAGAIVGAFAFEYLLHLFKDLPTLSLGGSELRLHAYPLVRDYVTAADASNCALAALDWRHPSPGTHAPSAPPVRAMPATAAALGCINM